MPAIPRADFEATITKVIRRLKNDPNDRLRSWDHCHKHFDHVRRQDSPDLDLATLNLGFYLASWGMYRGSSDLLQKDYRVLTSVARILLSERFQVIWEMDFSEADKDKANTDIILKAKDAITTALHQAASVVNEERRTIEVTGTLASKVLLIPGCVVAFDIAVQTALHTFKIGPSFVERNVCKVITLLRDNRELLNTGCGKLIEQVRADYPPMKILDLYLWYKGLEILDEQKRKKRKEH